MHLNWIVNIYLEVVLEFELEWQEEDFTLLQLKKMQHVNSGKEVIFHYDPQMLIY